MSKIVLLDTTPLGILANPKLTPVVRKCRRWAADLVATGCRVIVPEISDYETRRELLRAGKVLSVQALDALAIRFEYLPLTTAVMKHAAQLWAYARNTGQQTAHDHDLDGDMILCAQALSFNDPTAVIATGNHAHIARFAPAADWQTITP